MNEAGYNHVCCTWNKTRESARGSKLTFITKPTWNPRGGAWNHNFPCGRCAPLQVQKQHAERHVLPPFQWPTTGRFPPLKTSTGFRWESFGDLLSEIFSARSSPQTYVRVTHLRFTCRHLKAADAKKVSPNFQVIRSTLISALVIC